MNKYKIALYTLTDYFHSYTDANGLVHEKHINDDYLKAIATLKELIDNQADYMSFKELKSEYDMKLNRYVIALEKACIRIAENETILGWANQKQKRDDVRRIKMELLHDND